MNKARKVYNKFRRDIKKQGFNPKDFLKIEGNIVYIDARFAPAIYLGESRRVSGVTSPSTEGTYMFEFED